MTRSVDDVDLDPVVENRGVLGQDGDTPLPLEIVAVHDQITGGVGITKDIRLFQETIDQRCLAVIDVSDDRHIAQLVIRGDIFRGDVPILGEGGRNSVFWHRCTWSWIGDGASDGARAAKRAAPGGQPVNCARQAPFFP